MYSKIVGSLARILVIPGRCTAVLLLLYERLPESFRHTARASTRKLVANACFLRQSPAVQQQQQQQQYATSYVFQVLIEVGGDVFFVLLDHSVRKRKHTLEYLTVIQFPGRVEAVSCAYVHMYAPRYHTVLL